ncbi:MFS transporter [Escherichia coli]|uniref:MFS transporter n=1 Tax=Escherichia coli TaxID=562 RepID=UPI002033BBB5|nr:MFS transporter [Escherichia coli]
MMLDTVDKKKKGVHTRYLILLIIFIVTAVNYADRATLSIAGTEVAKELQLSAVSMGYIFSAFGWAYLLMQIPGGWLLDKFGSKKVYTYSLFFWSLFTFLQGFVDMFPLAWPGLAWPGLGWDLHVLYALYAGVLGSAIIPGERPYCRRLVPDERTWYCLRHL